MEALEMLRSRRSIKKYDERRMPSRELLETIADAGQCAPSGRGAQSAFIVVVTNRTVRDELSRLNAEVLGTTAAPFYGAPVVMAVLADRRAHTAVYDGAVVMENLLLAAHALNLGACWIHRGKEVFESPDGQRLLQEWGIQDEVEGIGFCVVGYPAADPKPARPRKEGYIRFVE